ncbi:MAG: hypothetical protein MRERV_35c027 [Mycoplasmataceae bacterium RV_VA103A]|nr:MAG: hypothetical protein MRERV_35c027 [Mycoplasmataceae bacterium RV_VA103A]
MGFLGLALLAKFVKYSFNTFDLLALFTVSV